GRQHFVVPVTLEVAGTSWPASPVRNPEAKDLPDWLHSGTTAPGVPVGSSSAPRWPAVTPPQPANQVQSATQISPVAPPSVPQVQPRRGAPLWLLVGAPLVFLLVMGTAGVIVALKLDRGREQQTKVEPEKSEAGKQEKDRTARQGSSPKPPTPT